MTLNGVKSCDFTLTIDDALDLAERPRHGTAEITYVEEIDLFLYFIISHGE